MLRMRIPFYKPGGVALDPFCGSGSRGTGNTTEPLPPALVGAALSRRRHFGCAP